MAQPRAFARPLGNPLLALTIGLVSLMVSSAHGAEPKPSTPPNCGRRCLAPRSAIDTVARAIAAGLADVPQNTVVISAPLSGEPRAPRAEALARELARQIAGRIGPRAHFSQELQPRKKLLERPLPSKAAALVHLRPSIRGGRLRVVADGYAAAVSVWSRARGTLSGPLAHSQAIAPIDAEVRSYLNPLSFGAPLVSKFQGADPKIVALACGDLDGDGGNDLVTVTRSRILLVGLVGDRVVRLREAKWSSLAPIAATPLREPLAFATIVESPRSTAGDGFLDVALSDRRGSVRLDAQLRRKSQLAAVTVPHARRTACTQLVDLKLSSKRGSCGGAGGRPVLSNLAHRADATASTALVARDGSVVEAVALRAKGVVRIKTKHADRAITGAGAQLAIGDIDQDGALDLISTVDTLQPNRDAVYVRTISATGIVKTRYRVPVPSGVQAVSLCPPDGSGRAPIVVATGEQLWVLR